MGNFCYYLRMGKDFLSITNSEAGKEAGREKGENKGGKV